MKRRLEHALASRLTVATSLLLLLVLAGLQYRWTGRIAEADLERQRADLTAAATNLQTEIELELRHMAMSFRPGTGAASDLVDRFDAWREVATHATLLRDVWVCEPGPAPRAVHLDAARGAASAAELPEEIAALVARHPGTGAAIDPELLAFVLPPGMPGHHERSACVILRLDRAVLAESLVPDLVARHFPDTGYDVTLRDPRGTVVFTRGTPVDVAAADVTVALLDPPPMRGMGGPPWMHHGHAGASSRAAWILAVAHHAGSLARAIDHARVHNLTISLFILGVLAVALVQASLATRRAENLARQQIEFVASVSHELRTPLTAVRTAGRNLADGVVTGDDAVREYGLLIESEGRRLSETVDNVMLHARMGSERAPRPDQLVDVAGLVEEVATEGPWTLSRAPVEIEHDSAPGLPAVRGDREALRRALVNLIDNAIRHGGPWVAIRARPAAGGVAILVEDHGPGIPGDDLARMFEPFWRGDHGRSGAGLGLALVREVAIAHGGRIEAGSRPEGPGAMFTLTLPGAASEARS